MRITGIVPQLRTTDMASSIRFYTEKLGFSVEFSTRIFTQAFELGGRSFT
jgi:catechol 2,3-dioxygenase-like lactoylglutathione lyase family enzyme